MTIIQASTIEKKFTKEELEAEERNVRVFLTELFQIVNSSDISSPSQRGSLRNNLIRLSPQRLEEFRHKLFDPNWMNFKEKGNTILWTMKPKSNFSHLSYKVRGIIKLSIGKAWESFLFVQKRSQYLDKNVTSTTYLEGGADSEIYTLQTLYRMGSPFTPREFIITYYCCEPMLNERYFIYETPSYVKKFPEKKGHVRAHQYCNINFFLFLHF